MHINPKSLRKHPLQHQYDTLHALHSFPQRKKKSTKTGPLLLRISTITVTITKKMCSKRENLKFSLIKH